MPVTLSIKNVPDEVAERLRLRAEKNHRSLQGELLALVEEAAMRSLTVLEIWEAGKGLNLPEEPRGVDIIRADRDR